MVLYYNSTRLVENCDWCKRENESGKDTSLSITTLHVTTTLQATSEFMYFNVTLFYLHPNAHIPLTLIA